MCSNSGRVQAVTTKSGRELRDALDDYCKIRVLAESADAGENEREQPRLVSRYYDLVTDFYERAWGQSFHFSLRRRGETLAASQRRHEEGIGRRLRLHPSMEVADIGCGVGGPMVTIARATGARITGLNFNAGRLRAARTGCGMPGWRIDVASCLRISSQCVFRTATSMLPTRSTRFAMRPVLVSCSTNYRG